jgi:hypothetical protein
MQPIKLRRADGSLRLVQAKPRKPPGLVAPTAPLY